MGRVGYFLILLAVGAVALFASQAVAEVEVDSFLVDEKEDVYDDYTSDYVTDRGLDIVAVVAFDEEGVLNVTMRLNWAVRMGGLFSVVGMMDGEEQIYFEWNNASGFAGHSEWGDLCVTGNISENEELISWNVPLSNLSASNNVTLVSARSAFYMEESKWDRVDDCEGLLGIDEGAGVTLEYYMTDKNKAQKVLDIHLGTLRTRYLRYWADKDRSWKVDYDEVDELRDHFSTEQYFGGTDMSLEGRTGSWELKKLYFSGLTDWVTNDAGISIEAEVNITFPDPGDDIHCLDLEFNGELHTWENRFMDHLEGYSSFRFGFRDLPDNIRFQIDREYMDASLLRYVHPTNVSFVVEPEQMIPHWSDIRASLWGFTLKGSYDFSDDPSSWCPIAEIVVIAPVVVVYQGWMSWRKRRDPHLPAFR